MSAKFPLPARPSFVTPSDEAGPLFGAANATAGPSTVASLPPSASSSSPAAPAPPAAAIITPPSPTSVDPTKCALCALPPKYTCPRCALPTCSLPCSRLHKTKYACSGQRDTSAFVPLSKYTQGEWGGDYAYLEATRRQVSLWGKDVSAREVERQEEVKKVKEREERRRYREQRWLEGQKEREEEEERRRKEEEVRRARERGEVGWGRAFVPGLPGLPGASGPYGSSGPGPASTPATLPTTTPSTANPDSSTTVKTPHYASLLDPATAVALNRANLGPDDAPHGRAGAQKGFDRNKKRPNRGGKLDAFMWEMRKRGVWVEFMPEGMERRRVNQSRWNVGSQELYITLQMIIPLDILPSPPQSTETDATTDPTPGSTCAVDTEPFSSAVATSDNTVTLPEHTAETNAASSTSKAAPIKAPRLATPPGVKVKYTDTHAIATFTQVLLYKGTGGKGGNGGNGRGKAGGAIDKVADAESGEAGSKGAEAGKTASGLDGAGVDAGATNSPGETSSGGAGTSPATFSKPLGAESPLPNLSTLFTSLIPTLSAADLVFALPFHPSPARPTPEPSISTSAPHQPSTSQHKGKPHFPPIDPSTPLGTALRGTAYVEFPILSVYKRDAWERGVREGKVRQVELAEPRGKRDMGEGGRGDGHGRGEGDGQGRGANDVPLSNKRTAGQGDVEMQVSDGGKGNKRARVDVGSTATPAPVASNPATSGAGASAKASATALTAFHAATTATTPTLTAHSAQPASQPPLAAASAISGLSALGGYGSDSDSDAEADSDPALRAVQPVDDNEVEDEGDLGYYDKPNAGESTILGAGSGSGSLAAGNGNDDAGGVQEQEQGQVSAEGIALEFGLSGEMMQAVGEALVADLS